MSEMAQTPADRLRASFKAAQQRRTIDLQMKGYDEFYITFEGVDQGEMQALITEAQRDHRHVGRTEQNKHVARAVLARASTDSYVIIDGQEFRIGLPLGLALYDYIWPATNGDSEGDPPPRPSTDTEAIALLFLDDSKMTSMFSLYQQWLTGVGLEEMAMLQGNF